MFKIKKAKRSAKHDEIVVSKIADELVSIVRDTLEKFTREYDQDRAMTDAHRSDIYTAIGKTNHRITEQYQKTVGLEFRVKQVGDQFNRLNRENIDLRKKNEELSGQVAAVTGIAVSNRKMIGEIKSAICKHATKIYDLEKAMIAHPVRVINLPDRINKQLIKIIQQDKNNEKKR